MDSPQEPIEQRGWFARLHLSWPMLLVTGWLLYELTAQSGLGALVACAKFGWADVRTAFWLRRVDPDRRRGQTCFWCCLAFGLWKVAMMATTTMIVFGLFNAILVCLRRQPLGNGNELTMFLGAMLAATIGGGLSCVATHIALWSAWRNDVPIWMGRAPRRAWQERFWPPCHDGINVAPFVIVTASAVTVWAFICVMFVFLLVCQPDKFWSTALVLFTFAMSALFVSGLLVAAKRGYARSPQECWNTEEEEAVYQAHCTEGEMSNA